MNENALVQKVISRLNSIMDCRARKRHGGKFQSGDPDVALVFRGRAAFVECKLPDGELTALQALQLEYWREAGAATFLGVFTKMATGKVHVRMIELCDSEKWSEFTGKAKLKELLATTANRSALPLSGFIEPWGHWLEVNVSSIEQVA